jgi:hypothetical protein
MMINPRGYRSKYDLVKEVPVTTSSTNTNSNS